MEKFKALMAKKREEKGTMEPVQAAARGSVLGDMMKSLDSEGAKKVKGIKKVTVASNDAKGLESGLDKAKEIVAQGESEIEGGDEHEDNLLKHELEESPEYGDEEAEEALEDSPLKHVHEAEANDELSMHGPNADPGAEEDMAEIVEGSPEHIASLKKELEAAKAHIAHLQKPKSFY